MILKSKYNKDKWVFIVKEQIQGVNEWNTAKRRH